MRKALLVVVTVAALALCAYGLAASWPYWRGPNKDGVSPETGFAGTWKEDAPEKLWQVAMHDGGYAVPSVADGKVLIIDHKGAEDIVRAIDLKTGKDVWAFSYPDSPRSNYGFARAAPVVDDGKVYTVSRLGLVHCLTLEDGEKQWAVNMKKEFGGRPPTWQYTASALIDGGWAIVVPGGKDACVAALHKETGKAIWAGGGSDKPGYATPVAATIDDVKQYVVFTAKNLIGVRAKDGKLLWRFPWHTRYDVNAATPIVRGNEIFITSNYRRGCALIRVSGNRPKTVWENKAIHSHFNTGILRDGHIYSPSDRGRLVCVEWKTGRMKWEQKGGMGKGGIVGFDDRLIGLHGSRGTVSLVKMTPDKYNELRRMDGLGGRSWTPPIIADGCLIIRNQKALACYKLPKK
ncbi:MAG: PQQ-binding-like beta-propeller repeat protein [bacterium]